MKSLSADQAKTMNNLQNQLLEANKKKDSEISTLQTKLVAAQQQVVHNNTE